MKTSVRKESILAVAATLYSEKGYDAVSMRDVASAVGMTPASLYHHFKDKEQLYRDVLVAVFSRMQDVLDGVAKEKKTDRYLDTFINALVKLCFDDPVYTRLMLRELNEGADERITYLTNKVFSRIYEEIRNSIFYDAESKDCTKDTELLLCLIVGHIQMRNVLKKLHGKDDAAVNHEGISATILAAFRRQIHEDTL